MKTGPPSSSYRREVIERFLCATHKVDHLGQMTPFGRMFSCWEIMRPVTLTVETSAHPNTVIRLDADAITSVATHVKRLDSHLPPPKVAFKQGKMEADLERVCPFSVVTRHVRSNVPIPVAVRLNFYHASLNELEKQEEHDELLAIGGAIKGAYMSISPTPPYGEDVEVAALKRRQFSYCNEFFASTMALVNEDNLQNGIIKIPPEVCREAGLRVFNGAPEPPDDWVLIDAMERMDMSEDDNDRAAQFKSQWIAQAERQGQFPISHYYAVPINHVLAWGLQSKEYAAVHKVDREEFFFTPVLPPTATKEKVSGPLGAGDILLYYLVSDVSMKAIQDDFTKHWMGKVDARPLDSIGFELVPLTGARRYPGLAESVKEVKVDVLTVRSTISYMVAPKLSKAQLANLAPTLCPTFPTCRDWDPTEAARQRDLERYLETKK